MKKYALIIDSYPSSNEQKERLINNLSILKESNIDVLLTSHYTCDEDIIDKCTYFLFEKKNNYHFLDSEIINENIKGIDDPVYMSYVSIGDEMFYNKLVITGWSVSITSQLFNSIKFLYGKGYDYAFYLVDDFICPYDIKEKLENIIKKSKRNYFIKNKPIFGSWFAPFLFGFTIDRFLIDKLPNIDISNNEQYQSKFPNCSFEDVMIKIWSNEENYIDNHSELDNIFGNNNWNLVSSVIKPGPSQLHNSTSSSIYFNRTDNNFCLMLYTYWDCLYDSVYYKINIKNINGDILYHKIIVLNKGHWFKDYIGHIFENNELLILSKEVISSDNTVSFTDDIVIDKKYLNKYSLVKNYERI